jgi:hypothetical protein
VAADESLPSVDDDQLAVVAVIQQPDVPDSPVVEDHHLAAGLAHLLQGLRVDVLDPVRIEQHPHVPASARLL